MPRETAPAAGLTVEDVCVRLRVGADKVRRWLAAGQLAGINVAASLAGRPRWVIPPEALAEFERRRSAAEPRPTRRARRPKSTAIDFYADEAVEARGR